MGVGGQFLLKREGKCTHKDNFGATFIKRLLLFARRDSKPRNQEPVLFAILPFLLLPTLGAIVIKYCILEVVSERVLWPRRDAFAVRGLKRMVSLDGVLILGV